MRRVANATLLRFDRYTERLEGVVRGVVTSNLVVTTQGGVVTTPPSKGRGCNTPPLLNTNTLQPPLTTRSSHAFKPGIPTARGIHERKSAPPIPPHGHCTHTNVLPTSVLPTIDLPTHDCLPTRIPLTFDPPSVAGLTLAGPMDSRQSARVSPAFAEGSCSLGSRLLGSRSLGSRSLSPLARWAID